MQSHYIIQNTFEFLYAILSFLTGFHYRHPNLNRQQLSKGKDKDIF